MRKKSLYIVIDTLQNGYRICHLKQHVKFGRKVKITPLFDDGISIPFYHLTKEFVLLKVIKNHKIELNLTLPFSGILTSNNKTIYLKDSAPLGKTYLLTEGDYASLAYRDLRFLIKINQASLEEPPTRRNPHYYPKLSALIFRDGIEVLSSSLGFLISGFLFACLITGFLTRSSDFPKGLEDLEKKYVLPFVHQSSLATLPEALKFHLNRTKYIPSLIKYYENVTALFNNWPIEDESYLFASSIDLFHRLYSEREKQRLALIATQKAADQRAKSQVGHGTISLPSSFESNFQNKLLETIVKVDNMQLGFNLALESRRRFLIEFLEDTEYEWGNYNGEGRRQDKKGSDALSKIVVFDQLNNENFMYDVGKKLGESASIIQRFHDRNRSQNFLLNSNTYKTVYVPVGIDFVSSSMDIDFTNVDQKMDDIKAISQLSSESLP